MSEEKGFEDECPNGLNELNAGVFDCPKPSEAEASVWGANILAGVEEEKGFEAGLADKCEAVKKFDRVAQPPKPMPPTNWLIGLGSLDLYFFIKVTIERKSVHVTS